MMLVCCWMWIVGIRAVRAAYGYAEALTLHQHADGRVTGLFAFERQLTATTTAIQIHSLQPQSTQIADAIGDAAVRFGVVHFELGLTVGTRCRLLGSDLSSCLPPGAVVWAWFSNDNGNDSSASAYINTEQGNAVEDKNDINSRWTGFTNALAGVLCASLNFVSPAVSAEPLASFAVQGVDPRNHSLRYASLPRESVCTENLTPWAKLLPCSTKAGIASLFNAYSIYDADYHSMGLVLSKPPSSPHVTISQSLHLVLDPVRKGYARSIDWSLDFLFGRRSIVGLCPLAYEGTNVTVVLVDGKNASFTGQITPTRLDNSRYFFSLQLGKPLQFGVKYLDSKPNREIDPATEPTIKLHRHLTGYGRERGGISIHITNNNPTASQNITLLEVVPWYLKIYLHTLKIDTTPVFTTGQTSPSSSSIANITTQRYQTSIDRKRPTVLEIDATLPPHSTTTFTYAFDRAFIKYTEHPPDANRGFDIGPSVVTVHNGESEDNRLYSEVLLIALPTPDFSMPYNVITMTCTIVALYFGQVFNLVVKRLEPMPEDKIGPRKWWMFWKRKDSSNVGGNSGSVNDEKKKN
ncbi:hypothetical protein HK100_003776 [Physocladia obscura]|uniref:Uncharacterized protein n=1 Tax=Physocladia obscura TaxID=109957 RepID=A0AAD5SUJ5_9FUNG|nr:hypothetical protein HK100_003776 [Physocladia obscura]